MTLCAAVSACFRWQPDWFAPVTLTPAWCWLVVGLLLTGLGFSRRYRSGGVFVLALWMGFALLFVEEVRSMARLGHSSTAAWQEAREQGRAVRVATLNCHFGNGRAAAEVAAYEPDIVLLQESPSRQELEALTRDMFGAQGSFLKGPDASILAAGQLEPSLVPAASHFVHAVVQLPSGFQANVISLRLSPPVFRLDFWHPGFWRDHRDKRVRHRGQIQQVADWVRNASQAGPWIIGGDFNSPPNDGALGPLKQHLSDTFPQAGRGWGSTGTSRFPLFRVDQIWVSPELRAESVVARRTVHSDHRMVICDLMIQQP